MFYWFNEIRWLPAERDVLVISGSRVNTAEKSVLLGLCAKTLHLESPIAKQQRVMLTVIVVDFGWIQWVNISSVFLRLGSKRYPIWYRSGETWVRTLDFLMRLTTTSPCFQDGFDRIVWKCDGQTLKSTAVLIMSFLDTLFIPKYTSLICCGYGYPIRRRLLLFCLWSRLSNWCCIWNS